MAIIKSAGIRIALVDHSKFGKKGFAFVGPVTELTTLITGSGTFLADLQTLKDLGVRVIVARGKPARSQGRIPILSRQNFAIDLHGERRTRIDGGAGRSR